MNFIYTVAHRGNAIYFLNWILSRDKWETCWVVRDRTVAYGGPYMSQFFLSRDKSHLKRHSKIAYFTVLFG